MPTIVPPNTPEQVRGPRPTPCPQCGLTADNAVIVHGEVVTTATYCCTEGHLFAVIWAVAA